MSNSQSQNFLAELQNSVKDNPLPAALIGIGLAWMFAGGHRMSAAAALLGSGARTAAGGIGKGAQTSTSAAMKGARTVGEGVTAVLTGGVSVASSAVSGIYDSSLLGADGIASSFDYRVGSTRALGGALRGNLAETFERQPLLLGAVGLAVGAGMAAAFAATRAEKELMGDAAETLKSKASELVSTTSEQVATAADRGWAAMQDEAQSQGLTSEALKSVKDSLVEKVRAVAEASDGRAARHENPLR